MRSPWGGIGWSPLSCMGPDCLRPVRPTAVPSWDLSVVLEGLVTAPFEPLESASDRILTLKVVLLLALTSLNRVGDLQAFSVSETCMDFAPGLVKVTLRPRPGYIPKVLSTSFRSQVVTLHSFHPPPFASSEDERLHLLCPVRSLKLYVDRSKVWRKSPQLLIWFGAGRRGLATSKQRISHWVRDAISLAYEVRNLPSPQIKSNHFYCHITTAQVPWWVKFLWACSRQCKKTNNNLHMDRQCKKNCTGAFTVLQTVQKKQQQFTYGQYIFTDCNVQNTHTYTQNT